MSTLTTELNRFCSCSKRLQTILDDTKRCFDDINESGSHEAGQLFTAELLHEEEQEVLSTAEKPPGIIVFGQNAHCKTKIVNSLFSSNIFPNFDKVDDNGNYRMVQFKYGSNLSLGLSLPDGYDLAENLEAYNMQWTTIPVHDMEIKTGINSNRAEDGAVLEVSFNHSMLRQGVRVVVTPTCCDTGQDLAATYSKCCEKLSPIIVYAFETESLTSNDMTVLETLRTTSHYQPVCFVRINPTVSSLPNGDIISQSPKDTCDRIETSNQNIGAITDARHHGTKHNNNNDVLSDLMRGATPGSLYQRKMTNFDEPEYNVSPPASFLASSGISREKKAISVISFSSTVFQQLCAIGYLSESPDSRNLANTMTSDYYEVDSELVDRFENFNDRFVYFVQQTVQRYLVNSATVLNNCHERCLNMFIVSAFDMARDMMITPKKLEFARDKEQDLYKSLMKISVEKSDEIKTMISDTIHDIHDSLVTKAEQYEFLGVEFSDSGEIKTPKGLKICTYQIQEVVLGALNQAIAGNLVRSVDVLRDSYTGTLSRCLESLERFDKEQQRNEKSTSEALKQILNAAYQVEISLQSSSSLIRVLLERMKQLVKAMPWSTQPRIDTEWKKKAACDILANLSEARLARNISSQIKERLNRSHDAFSGALRQLEQKHTGRLDKIEEERLKLRKVHAPRVAKMALESTSLKDVILHGMPQMSREIGRGQYGVVYSCDTWAGFSPCAIKSVVPPDDKHWNDLALEFYYTKNIPEHDRIVALRGSVIDYMYGGGSTPAVLLIMDRLQKDLYTAIKQGINWTSRIQVSIDVVEGIRFLHNQGLVHRDIKLKNVLIDKENRGKLTDLGFCKPEAMMSGSIVGTPIHMAPELFSGRYDNSVDVYAFGILFWYVCAGHVKLPSAFERCDNKDHLWTSVKKGLRPERLSTFDLECWNLMQECWEGEPFKRPLLGDVETRLKAIHEQYMKQPKPLSNSSSSRSRKISATRTKTPS